MKLGKINRQSIAISSFTSVLDTIAVPPAELYIAGTLPKTKAPVVSIVGSRQPTAYGREVTYTLAHDLARSGVIIVSGLALGVDAIAHQAALDAGGITVAVLANGLHTVYPLTNSGLARSIIKKGGAILSEKPLGYEAKPYDFLARNRIVSGLADAVLITEATDRSGTFSTAMHALTQNKELFAVPGPITSLLSAGSNRLLQQGAHVATQADDILSLIAPQHLPVQTTLPLGDTIEEVALITLIREGVRDGDALLLKSKLSTSIFLQTLTMLEIKGDIRSLGANTWTLQD